MNIRQVAAQAATELQQRSIPDSTLEAEVLVRHALGYDRAQFYAALNETLGKERLGYIHSLLQRRIVGEPLAYITGHREFYGLDFIVSSAVLIPRQETELLVDAALDFGREHGGGISIADIGTGSGAIAVAVASNLPQSHVYATDRSIDALAIAAQNCRKHGVEERVSLLQGDLLEPLPHGVDLIISNPPYIASELLPGLPSEVRREPQLALDGGIQGLDVIRRLIRQAPAKLNAVGRLVVEISPEQLGAVCEMAQACFPSAVVGHRNDLLGLARCVTIATKQ